MARKASGGKNPIRGGAKRGAQGPIKETKPYEHADAEVALRPEIGTQAQFRKKRPPRTYRYDSSLSPALNWDGQNPAREQAEALLAEILETHLASIETAETAEAAKAAAKSVVGRMKIAAEKLRRLGQPFLDWAGKAERLSFDVPTLPLFVHERLSTKAIIETLRAHERKDTVIQQDMFSLFGDPRRSVADQVLKAYEYKDRWVNRMILGDSLVVMNSLVDYERLGGQVQMIYIDPPYGVKFGSNFQPFVRDPGVDPANKDDDMTREPEMVKAYRDTWELGLHSYLTYLRDRLLLARNLLHPTGSVFVQISDQNLHHVREVMDEVFGSENFISQISFQTTSGFNTSTIATLGDFLLWYARDSSRVKVRKLFEEQPLVPGDGNAKWILLPDGSYRGVSAFEKRGEALVPEGARFYMPGDLLSQGAAKTPQPYVFLGKTYNPGPNHHWKANYPVGMDRLAAAGRIHVARNSIRYRRFADDFPFQEIGNIWTDTLTGSFTDEKLYVVQTNPKVVERCMMLTTDPGDLVLDPTCGSGTTAYVAEQWGRRWITIDTSRVPLALARQRIMTATFPYFELKDETRGPTAGFVYRRRQNKKGEESGGIVPHIMLETIANNEPPAEEVLVDRPEVDDRFVRVSGPFCVEATIPTPVDWEGDGEEDSGVGVDTYVDFVERMLEVLRRSPVLQLGGGKTLRLHQIRPPAKTLVLNAEALIDAGGNGAGSLRAAVDAAHERSTGALPLSQQLVAIIFGPENGAVSEKLVQEAIREANLKGYHHLYVIGFAIQAHARELIEKSEAMGSLPSTYVQATPDLMMGDLLKNMRTSQIFSVCGMPEIRVSKLRAEPGDGEKYQVILVGLDSFDPITMQTAHWKGDDVPCWMLDTDYNGLVFHGSQVFFPRTSAWENLKKALKATHEESVWEHLGGTTSAPFEAGEHATIAVKVIDDRGNELMVTRRLSDLS